LSYFLILLAKFFAIAPLPPSFEEVFKRFIETISVLWKCSGPACWNISFSLSYIKMVSSIRHVGQPKKLQQQQRHQLPANANLMRHAVEKHIPFPFSEPGWQQVVPGSEFQGPDEMTSFKFMHDPHCTSGWCSICFLAFAPPSTTHHHLSLLVLLTKQFIA